MDEVSRSHRGRVSAPTMFVGGDRLVLAPATPIGFDLRDNRDRVLDRADPDAPRTQRPQLRISRGQRRRVPDRHDWW